MWLDFQGIILSSFYWGYIVTQLPGALLAKKYGGKHVLGVGILLTALFTFATPLATRAGDWLGLIVLRVLVGLSEGVTIPVLHFMLARWIPAGERSKAGALVHAGSPLGTVFANVASGLLLRHVGRWPIVFYFFGALGVLWYVFWLALCHDSPSKHPFIGAREARYLHQELSEHAHERAPPVPWRQLLGSAPVWALMAAQVGNDWAFYTLATDLPKYMVSVLHVGVDTNGYLSSLPHLGMWLFCVTASWLADYCVSHGHMSLTTVRKAGTTVASVGAGVFIVAATYVGCSHFWTVLMFVLGAGLLGVGIPGVKVNPLDLTPNFAGTVMAMCNGMSATSGILTPYLVGVLAEDQTLVQWRLVFWIVFAMLISTNVVYLCFGSGEIVEWNDPQTMKERKSSEMACSGTVKNIMWSRTDGIKIMK